MTRARQWMSACAAVFALAIGGACSGSSDGGGSGGGSTGGNPGCTSAPNCASCQACFDSCLCNGADPQTCLLQCTNGVGGAGGVGGGTGGAAGATGGVGGTGATGGGTGATGGGANGGTGGGGFSCTQVSTSNPNCDSCIHGACCDQITACFTNSGCAGLAQCLVQNCSQTSNTSACAQQFCGQYLGAADLYNAMGQCFASNCAGAC